MGREGGGVRGLFGVCMTGTQRRGGQGCQPLRTKKCPVFGLKNAPNVDFTT